MAIKDERTGDGYEQQMQTNHLSHFLLTALLLPSLEAAATAKGSARIVNHSSAARLQGGPVERKYLEKCDAGTLGGNGSKARWDRYHQTKLANCVFTEALQVRAAPWPVPPIVCAVVPAGCQATRGCIDSAAGDGHA